jgi:hypothetical protein
MEHLLHLAAKHFVEAVVPAPCASIKKKAKLNKAQDEAHEGDDTSDSEDDNKDEDEFTSGDSLGKALALVEQVHLMC